MDKSIHVPELLALLLASSATAAVIKWVRIPYAVALVIAGLIIGLLKLMPAVSMSPDLILLILLPALLFEASWNFELAALRRDWLCISMLAVIGVCACTLGVAAILSFAGCMQLKLALLFGAMVSATDPVSVIALFRKTSTNKRLTMILEGESLVNDGAAAVFFKMFLALALSATNLSAVHTLVSFITMTAGGALIGSMVGYLASKATRAFDDHSLEITLTVIAAYGSFLLADHLQVSSVIAVVTAGIVIGNYGRKGMSATTRLAVNSFWEYAAFFVNSLLFLLIGLQIQLALLLKYSQLIGLSIAGVILSRLLVVYTVCPCVSTFRLPIPISWRHILFWGGLRGALAMALALSLPLSFPDREIIVNVTFGVVLFTLLIPGLSMEWLLKLLSRAPKEPLSKRQKEEASLLLLYKKEMQELVQLKEQGEISAHSYVIWRMQLEELIAHLEQDTQNPEMLDSAADEAQDRRAELKLLRSRKEMVAALLRDGSLTQGSAHSLSLAIDSELDQVTNKLT